MRLFCISTFRQLPINEHIFDVVPYNSDAHERNARGHYHKNTIENEINYSKNLNKCMLTEIVIGYQLQGLKKYYFMVIYRKDTQTIKIPMVRGAVMFKELPNKEYDFIIATSKIFTGINFDICINVCCIRNTTVKTIITAAEEKIYESYSKKIDVFCSENNYSKEDALKALPTFKLPNTTTEKVYKQKIQDVQDLVHLLCHPEIGKFKNIEQGSRIDQRLSCYLAKRKCSDAKYLENVENKENIEIIEFVDVINIFDSFKRFEYLSELTLRSCKIQGLFDKFVLLLPPNLLVLDVEDNDVTFISNKISNLKMLQSLSLMHNENLTKIPWKFLPVTLRILNLRWTKISKIPSDIQMLTNLETLGVVSENLEHVSWNHISVSIMEIHVQGNGNLNDFDLSDKINLICLAVIKAGIKTVDSSNIPLSVERLILTDNKLTTFEAKNLLNLKYLYLRNNCLTSFAWETLPPSLWYLFLKENELTSIGKVDHLTQLRLFEASFNKIHQISNTICHLPKLANVFLDNNQLSSLPIGFENLTNVLFLHLHNNIFNYWKNDLNCALWERIPKFVEELKLSNNILYKIPCLLKDINIKRFYVTNCQLECFCPYIVTQKEKTLQSIYVGNNSKIKNLPFIPTANCQRRFLAMYGNNIETTTKGRKNLTYIFKPYGTENATNFCKCCAKCGQNDETKKIQQMMLMDFKICIFENSTMQLHNPGEWKTEVVTNLCESCIDLFKRNNNEVRSKNSVLNKKRKATTKIFYNIPRPLLPPEPFNTTILDDSQMLNNFSTDSKLEPGNTNFFNIDEETYYSSYQYHQDLPPSSSRYSTSFYPPYSSRPPTISLKMANPNSHKWERYTLIGQDELMEPSKNMQLYSLNHCTSIQHPADGGIKALPVNNNGEPLIQNLSSSYNEANILEVVPSQNSSQYQNYLFSANAVNTQSSTTALPPIDSFNLNKNISRNLEYI